MAAGTDSPELGSLEAKIMRVAWDDAGQYLQVRDVMSRLLSLIHI